MKFGVGFITGIATVIGAFVLFAVGFIIGVATCQDDEDDDTLVSGEGGVMVTQNIFPADGDLAAAASAAQSGLRGDEPPEIKIT